MNDVRIGSGGVDYAALYDGHAEYSARRIEGTYEQRLILLEAVQFKIPSLLRVCAGRPDFGSVVEIGCATGELIANFPVAAGGTRLGCDISAENVAAARTRFPNVQFRCGDFRQLSLSRFDCAILSDVLEHVEDDVQFLRCASALADVTLINLPLEDNWLNRRRQYGPADPSGHLRAYTMDQGLMLIRDAGLQVLCYERVWIHEMPVERMRRNLREEMTGAAFSGSIAVRLAKSGMAAIATAIPPIGRRLLASNLFVLASAQKP